MDDNLQRLADRREIEDLLIAYCRCLDRMDLETLVTLFTEDCTVRFGPAPLMAAEGRAMLKTSMARLWRWQRTAHHLSNISVDFEADDSASTESYVLAWHEAPDGLTATVYGRYLDRVRRTSDGWKIGERLMDMNGDDEGFTVPIPQAPRRPPPPGWVPPKGIDGGRS